MSNISQKTAWPVHGAFDYSELEALGLHPQEVMDFSVNANPYGPSPRVREAVAQLALDRYPDRACLALRRAILRYELSTTNLTLDALVCGNGTAELIWAIARTYLRPGLKAVVIGPTFGEYRAACLAVGATLLEYRARASEHFQPDVEEIAAWLEKEPPALVWLCNPNNPTGTWLHREHIQALAEVCRNIKAILVVDEAYWRFLIPQESFSALELLTNADLKIIVLRSLTKDFALAGLRLGYIVASVAIASALYAQLPSWNVNGAAQIAGVAALTDRLHLQTTLKALTNERGVFFQALEDNGLRMLPSRTHFCLLRVGDAHHVRQQLLTRKILVRDCTSFGLPDFIRVSTRPQAEWQKLLATLQEVL